MATSESFASLLRHERHAAGLTLEQLSEHSGVSVRAISNMELGHSLGPQRKTLELIADSLELAQDDREALLEAAQAGRRRVFEPAPAILAVPRGVSDFVGRASEMAFLAKLVASHSAGPAPVVVVSGTPGVGKTSFAVHAAAKLDADFPDGQLFLDLCGLDEHPLDTNLILGRLINAVAPGQREVPHDVVERAGLYRTLLTGRRLLIVLDNAADEAQVRMLLPGSGSCLMLITSRRRLSGLETAHRLSLVPLTRAYAIEMLTNLIGPQASTDSATVQRLADLSGNLPLALRLIGNRLASDGGTGSARFVRRLSDEERRLDTLTAGDMRISAVFISSYLQLSGEAQRLFRRLALIPGGDTGPEMTAVLANRSLESIEPVLDELVEFGLLQSRFTDRYRLHDLIRLFARARLDDEESPADIGATRDRVEDWLLSTATVAGRWFEPDFGTLPVSWDDRVPLDNIAVAQRWIESEADNWLAALRRAATEGRAVAVVAVAEAMHWFSDRWAHWGNWTEVFSLASVAAAELGDAAVTATQLNYLSWALNTCNGDSSAAIEVAQRAYATAALVHDTSQQGWARQYQALAQFDGGDAVAALAAAREASQLLQLAGDRDGLPQALGSVGRGYEELGRIDEALEIYHQKLAVVTDPATAPSSVVAAVSALSARVRIGGLHVERGEWSAAVEALSMAVAPAEAAGIPLLQARALTILGQALCKTGHRIEGVEHLQTAEAVYLRLNDTSETARIQALLRSAG